MNPDYSIYLCIFWPNLIIIIDLVYSGGGEIVAYAEGWIASLLQFTRLQHFLANVYMLATFNRPIIPWRTLSNNLNFASPWNRQIEYYYKRWSTCSRLFTEGLRRPESSRRSSLSLPLPVAGGTAASAGTSLLVLGLKTHNSSRPSCIQSPAYYTFATPSKAPPPPEQNRNDLEVQESHVTSPRGDVMRL